MDDAQRGAARAARRKGLAAIAIGVLLAALAWGAWQWVHGDHLVETVNAYAHGDIVVVTPQVAGTVVAIHGQETDRVAAGQLLVTLDSTDSQNTLRRSAIDLAQTVRTTRALYMNTRGLRSTIAIRRGDLDRAKVELRRVTEAYTRREALQAGGAVSREELQSARAAYDAARSGVAGAQLAVVAAREALDAQLALTEGVPVERHPTVQAAALAMREAWLSVRRAEVRAPLAGQLARRNVQVGQRVAAGASLMSVIALERIWVEANFKEVQLGGLRIGQPARVTSDLHGSSVEYTGRVVGLAAGTGSAFSLLPAQNATGNWIKVVQRIPVRIELDPAQLARHPLRIGASMRVTVDTRERGGPVLAPPAPGQASVRTDVFEALERGADEAVDQVIREHLGAAAERRVGGAGRRASRARSAARS